VLSRQRRRWHRGITEILIRHRAMLGRPRYGRIGLVVLPYYVVFEVLAPLVELSAVVLIPTAVAINAVDFAFAGQFLLIAYVYAILVSLVAVVFEELSFHRFHRWSDLVAIVIAAILENLGYRQFTAMCQLKGSWDAVRGHKHVWGTMPRAGFTAAE
jgi:cellulose synthase/poly-beta-1,6-N-acetylglucosamine synthase-like glycosyltransferase